MVLPLLAPTGRVVQPLRLRLLASLRLLLPHMVWVPLALLPLALPGRDLADLVLTWRCSDGAALSAMESREVGPAALGVCLQQGKQGQHYKR